MTTLLDVAVMRHRTHAVETPQPYRMCVRCIMDTSDPEIAFDADGVCFHCRAFEDAVRDPAYLRRRQPGAFERLVSDLKRAGRGKPYDCLLGVSGGVDSTYAALVAHRAGLRVLAVHLDNGWNSSLAVGNIEKALNKLNIDLFTWVLDWEEFRDLQIAFLKAGTPDGEIPTDHAIQGAMYAVAARRGIPNMLTGTNTATEALGVPAWSQGHGDWRYIRAVHRRFGRRPLRTYPNYAAHRFFYYALVRGIRRIPILDYVDYNKQQAIEVLRHELNWVPYGEKHGESTYTKFYQGYVLPTKFGFDFRRLHLSSLVWSGQMSRDEAVGEWEQRDYTEAQQLDDKEYVVKKLGLSMAEFEQMMSAPPNRFLDYPSYKRSYGKYRWLRQAYRRLKLQ
jgi:N-acetyl sugar amidotransferase